MNKEEYQKIKEKYSKIEQQLSNPAIFGDPKKLAQISKDQSELKSTIELIKKIEEIEENIKQNQAIIKEDQDQELKEMAEAELKELNQENESLKKQIEEETRPKNPLNKKNIIMTL